MNTLKKYKRNQGGFVNHLTLQGEHGQSVETAGVAVAQHLVGRDKANLVLHGKAARTFQESRFFFRTSFLKFYR